MQHLDLYAKIEPLIGFYDTYNQLYNIYLESLSDYEIESLLDVGCGNGVMLTYLQDKYLAKGIDLSAEMVHRAKERGVNASCQTLESITEKFDAIIAVADVLNYLDHEALDSFMGAVSSALNPEGIFICDINTLFGFEEVTAGSMSWDHQDQFLAIEADFEDEVLTTHITLFEKDGALYRKEQAEILQYYHTIEQVCAAVTDLQLISAKEVALFGEEIDKNILIFHKGSQ
ncbi:MAG: class I SAM-dependent methyltransferase [Epsilonproteobacteria bacterium]|nr:class I SAM-dependent methyltransferase [Campylobacterota bacterium]